LRWAGHIARMEDGRSIFKILTGTSTGKRPLGRPRHRWEDSTRMDLKEIGVNTRNWVNSAQKRDYWKVLLNAALNCLVPYVIELEHEQEFNTGKKEVPLKLASQTSFCQEKKQVLSINFKYYFYDITFDYCNC
jgi:hypothetical protein